MKRNVTLIFALVAMLAGACTPSSNVPVGSTAPTARSLETIETTASSDATENVAEYRIPSDSELSQAGNQGYWFRNSDSSLFCTSVVTGHGDVPYLRCHVHPPFPVVDRECDTGMFVGSEATLFTNRVQHGTCASDISLQQMCLSDPEALGEGATYYCESNLHAAPVLQEGATINTGEFTCHMGAVWLSCSNKEDMPLRLAIPHSNCCQ